MKKLLTVYLIMALIFTTISMAIALPTENNTIEDPQDEETIIQMAILLDTSNSMDGLINQAKTQLWRIVNELSHCWKKGKQPILEVALFEYGKLSIPYEEGYLRMVLPLTKNLDKISQELFALKTYGGYEYCGQVIQSATRDLKWTTNDKALKVIFIAGNETFTQGQVDYVTAINEAVKKDIIVNTIFCGNYYEGINTFWKDGADRGNGKYMSIDQNRKVIDIRAPQDDRIIELGIALNDTYIVYGEQGAENKELQTSQDSNAQQMSNDSYVQRQVAKSSSFYSNASWDLVDAVRLGVVKIEEVDNELLPENMKSMDIEEKEAYIQEMQEMRDSIQAEINQLNIERNEYIENELKNQSGEDSLDTAIINIIREQAESKNFTFE